MRLTKYEMQQGAGGPIGHVQGHKDSSVQQSKGRRPIITSRTNIELIAHRGWSTRFPENSFPAFSAAIAAGADQLEFDVRVSKDGIPFVIHDSTLDRTTDCTGKVAELSAQELKRANLLDPQGDRLLGLGIPTLYDVLTHFAGLVGLNIHIKGIDQGQTPLHLLSQYTPSPDRPFYIAGNRDVLGMALKICPHIPRCYVQARNSDASAVFQHASELGCERIQFFKGYYQPCHLQSAVEMGFVTNLYWADESGEAEEAVRGGVRALLTNDIGPIHMHLSKMGANTRAAGYWD